MNDRKITPINKEFFCDGYWYLLSSSSLGGSNMSAAEISRQLQVFSQFGENARQTLLGNGICLPLSFDGDCELVPVFVEGELTAQEQSEWIGRFRGRLEIPCGELILTAGWDEDVIGEAITSTEADDTFFKLKVQPGSYVIEIYAFLGSLVALELLNRKGEIDESGELDPEKLKAWWQASRPGEPLPEWIQEYLEEGDFDSENYLSYIIRVVPAEGNENLVLPELHKVYGAIGENSYEIRELSKCPAGLLRCNYFAEASEKKTPAQPKKLSAQQGSKSHPHLNFSAWRILFVMFPLAIFHDVKSRIADFFKK